MLKEYFLQNRSLILILSALAIALCMNRALKSRQYAYRIGEDEFVIICRKSSKTG